MLPADEEKIQDCIYANPQRIYATPERIYATQNAFTRPQNAFDATLIRPSNTYKRGEALPKFMTVRHHPIQPIDFRAL